VIDKNTLLFIAILIFLNIVYSIALINKIDNKTLIETRYFVNGNLDDCSTRYFIEKSK